MDQETVGGEKPVAMIERRRNEAFCYRDVVCGDAGVIFPSGNLKGGLCDAGASSNGH